MKKRNFYPLQVLRAMARKDVQSLDNGQQHALKYFLRHTRKIGIPIGVLQATDISNLRAEKSGDLLASAAAILGNCKTRVFLKRPRVEVPRGVIFDEVPFFKR